MLYELSKIDILVALFGGMTIGLSVTAMLLFLGRVTGISGILYGSLFDPKTEKIWRLIFIAGLLSGGALVFIILPENLENSLNHSPSRVALAGFLVGFGTLLGSGCTSGHGVCGLSRLSKRSILATITFMLSGVSTVLVIRLLTGGV